MTELVISLQPKQKLFAETIDRTAVTFYGGAKGGGKSRGLRDIFLIRRFRYPQTAAAIFRQTYAELEGNHIRPMLQQYPMLGKFYNDSKKLLSLPNGSTIEFCYAMNEKDLDRYQGREWDDLGIDEITQWTEAMFRKLHGSNRSSRPGIKPRAALTGNPGGIGHGWVKRIFIDKRFHSNERSADYNFIQAKVDDNAALMENDPDYVHKLDSNPNMALRKAYRDGDWDIFAGQFFQEISKDIHFIKPFDIPPHWNRFGAYDYGFNHPAAFGWFANDEDGNTYLYREFVRAQMRVDLFIAELKKFGDTSHLSYIVAGHDCWAKKNNTINVHQGANPPTIAEEFAANELFLKQAIIDRIQGAAQMRKYLAWQHRPPSNKPRFYMFNTCPVTFDAIARMIHDPDRVEDVLKVDATEGDPLTGDDPYDMTRYGLMSRPILSDAFQPKLIIGTKAWNEKLNENTWDREREHLEKQTQGGEWPSSEGGWSTF